MVPCHLLFYDNITLGNVVHVFSVKYHMSFTGPKFIRVSVALLQNRMFALLLLVTAALKPLLR